MVDQSSPSRFDIVEEARSWIGTRYHDQACVKKAGADCIGVVRGIYYHFYGDPGVAIPPYNPMWFDFNKNEMMMKLAGTHLKKIEIEDATVGDVLIFRMRPTMAAKHCGIITEDNRMIHSLFRRSVEEVTIGPFYKNRIVGAYQFPGVHS